MLTGKQKEEYAECVVVGSIPDQETFTKEEVLYLIRSVGVWAKTQIEHEIDEMTRSSPEEIVSGCEYKNILEAVRDTQDHWEQEMLALADFAEQHFY